MEFSWKLTKNWIIPTEHRNFSISLWWPNARCASRVLAVKLLSPRKYHRIRLLAIKVQFPASPCLCWQGRECCVWVGGRKCEGWAVKEFGVSRLPPCPCILSVHIAALFDAAALCQPLAAGREPSREQEQGGYNQSSLYFLFPAHPVQWKIALSCVWFCWGIICIFWGICVGAAILCTFQGIGEEDSLLLIVHVKICPLERVLEHTQIMSINTQQAFHEAISSTASLCTFQITNAN